MNTSWKKSADKNFTLFLCVWYPVVIWFICVYVKAHVYNLYVDTLSLEEQHNLDWRAPMEIIWSSSLLKIKSHFRVRSGCSMPCTVEFQMFPRVGDGDSTTSAANLTQGLNTLAVNFFSFYWIRISLEVSCPSVVCLQVQPDFASLQCPLSYWR